MGTQFLPGRRLTCESCGEPIGLARFEDRATGTVFHPECFARGLRRAVPTEPAPPSADELESWPVR